MANIVNERFPHHVKVFRSKKDENGVDVYDKETGGQMLEPVFESECGLRDMVRGTDVDLDVIKADYKLAIPRTRFIIKVRDVVEFTHSYTGEVIRGDVESYKCWNLGANIWFQSNGNKYG